MFFVVKKRNLILAVALTLILALTGTGIALTQAGLFSQKKKTVVIDAGHGGADRGVVGKNGLVEADLNLCISLLLEEKLKSSDLGVTMTRRTKDGLYGELTDNFKARDFAARKKTIVDADPDMVVSIHANKFPGNASRRGIQVFYNAASGEGKNFAVAMQEKMNVLNEKYVGKTYSPLAGDYFMLNCTQNPSIIVECGFLSNEEDEKLLSDGEYRQELTDMIVLGIVDYCF